MKRRPPTERASGASGAIDAPGKRGPTRHPLSALLMIFAVGAGARAKPTVLELALQIFENATTDEMKAKLMLVVFGFVAINMTSAMLGEDGNESGEGAEPDSKKGKGDDDEAFKPAAPPGWAMTELLKLCKIAAEIEFQLTPDPYATSTYDYKSIPVPVIHNIRGAMVAILRNTQLGKGADHNFATVIWKKWSALKGALVLEDGTAVTDTMVLRFFRGFAPVREGDSGGGGGGGSLLNVAQHLLLKHKMNALVSSIPNDFVNRFNLHEKRVSRALHWSCFHNPTIDHMLSFQVLIVDRKLDAIIKHFDIEVADELDAPMESQALAEHIASLEIPEEDDDDETQSPDDDVRMQPN